MSSASALHLYRQLTQAGEDETRAHILAEAFAELEDRYPNLKDLATQGHVRESELRLQKEIETVRLEIKEAEGRLRKEIETVRLELRKEIETVRLEIKQVEGRLQKEIREVDARLQKEIETVRLEIKQVELRLQKEIESVRVEVKNVEVRLTQAIHRHTLWVIGAIGSIIGIIRLLDWFLAHLPPAP
jgi:chromosome segregation ATPase